MKQNSLRVNSSPSLRNNRFDCKFQSHPTIAAIICNIGSSHLVGAGHIRIVRQIQVRVDLMFWVRLAGIQSWCHGHQSKVAHQPLDPFGIEDMAQTQ
jgi:hypothetical protein